MSCRAIGSLVRCVGMHFARLATSLFRSIRYDRTMAFPSAVEEDKMKRSPQQNLNNADRQEREEYEIFSSFAAVAVPSIEVDSIRKRLPPAPDFECRVTGLGIVAFELVESVDNSIAQKVSGTCELRKAFNSCLATLDKREAERFEDAYGNAILQFAFHDKVSNRERKAAIPRCVTELLSFDSPGSGDVDLSLSLRQVVKRLHIYRGRYRGPIFDDSTACAFAEPTLDRIKGKFEKRYESPHPIELLCYFGVQPVVPVSHWLPDVEDLVRTELPGSQFTRVRIYDYSEKVVIYDSVSQAVPRHKQTL
jgi:hypothetical protein